MENSTLAAKKMLQREIIQDFSLLLAGHLTQYCLDQGIDLTGTSFLATLQRQVQVMRTVDLQPLSLPELKEVDLYWLQLHRFLVAGNFGAAEDKQFTAEILRLQQQRGDLLENVIGLAVGETTMRIKNTEE